VAGGQDACHVEDLLVDYFVSDVAGYCLVRAQPVLYFFDVHAFARF
jgi:hypothetical protein